MTARRRRPIRASPRDQLVRRVLTAAGLVRSDDLRLHRSAGGARLRAERRRRATIVAVANPLSAKFDVLRPSLAARACRRRRAQPPARPARRRRCSRSAPASRPRRRRRAAWRSRGPERRRRTLVGPAREVDFFDVKGVVEQLCEALGVDRRASTPATAAVSRGRAERPRSIAGGTPVGIVGPVDAGRSPSERGAPRQDNVFVAELDLDRLAALGDHADERVRPLPRYPFVVRDLSIRRRRVLACRDHSWHHSGGR